ncbi:MAG: hypothetical protein L0Z53_07015 [Acidobacteriales bacterium]|nr:hypothetical protein [Terriglobales bacterium]
MSKFKNISRKTRLVKSYRCPCCSYKTLHGRGHFEICPVCYWEDDGQGNHDADRVRGGPNGRLNLTTARKNFRRFRVADPKDREHVRPPLRGEI